MPRFRLIPVLLLALGLAGCASTRGSATANQPVGKVPIQYLYGDADRTTPPAGFHVRRSASAAGPFERLTAKPIPAPANPDFTRPTVIHTDSGLPGGSTWYYFLEVVDSKGNTRKATPVVSARVMLPSESAIARKVAPKEEKAVSKAAKGSAPRP